MPRVKRGFKRRQRTKKVLKKAKGYHGGRSKLIRTAMETVDKALAYAYKGRKIKKRDFRALWQTRIAAAAKANGLSYSKLIGCLKTKGCELDRKSLSEIAIHHPKDFAELVKWSNS